MVLNSWLLVVMKSQTLTSGEGNIVVVLPAIIVIIELLYLQRSINYGICIAFVTCGDDTSRTWIKEDARKLSKKFT